MFTFKTTSFRLGIQVWGNRQDFRQLYESLWECWDVQEMTPEESISYLGIISYFAYEVRHSFMGDRLVTLDNKPVKQVDWDENMYIQYEKEQDRFQVGMELSWPQYFFCLASWWECVRQHDCPPMFLSTLKLFENEADKVLHENYKQSESILPYLHGAIYGGHPYLMHVMNEVHANYIEDSFYKRPTMKQLAAQMERASVGTDSYISFIKHLENSAKRLSCSIANLHAGIDDSVYNAKL